MRRERAAQPAGLETNRYPRAGLFKSRDEPPATTLQLGAGSGEGQSATDLA